MESTNKTPENLSPILNDLLLLGGSGNNAMSTIDLSFDGSTISEQRKEEAKKLELGIEDTKSKWASLRSSLKPVTGEWIQAKEDIMESLAINNQNSDTALVSIVPMEAEPIMHEHEEDKELLSLLNEATSYLKEELGVIKSELSNMSLYKGAIQSLGNKIGEGEESLAGLGEKVSDTAWVIGQKLDDIDGRIELFKNDLPAIHNSTNEVIVGAIKDFEDKCLKLGAAQLESLSRIHGVACGSQLEELQDSLVYLINGQKRILDSISDILMSLKAFSHSVGSLPGSSLIERIAEKQEAQIESVKLNIVEARFEDRKEDRFLKRAVITLGLVCALTFAAIIYSIIG